MTFDRGNIPKETLNYLASKKAESEKDLRKFGAMLGVGLLVLIIVGIAIVLQGDSASPTTKPQQTSAAHNASPLPYNPDQSIAKAKSYIVTKEYQSALDELRNLQSAELRRPDVRAIATKATRELKRTALTEGRLDRIAYAKDYELSLLGAGMDATVRAVGRNAETLTITFVLVNRPLVYQIENDHKLSSVWLSHGFTNVHLSDGFDSSWSYKLN